MHCYSSVPLFSLSLSHQLYYRQKKDRPVTRPQALEKTSIDALLLVRSFIQLFSLSRQLYYRQKKDRPVTRPQALEETFEHCAETVVHKLQSYLVQANEYHNKCLQGEYKGLLFTKWVLVIAHDSSSGAGIMNRHSARMTEWL